MVYLASLIHPHIIIQDVDVEYIFSILLLRSSTSWRNCRFTSYDNYARYDSNNYSVAGGGGGAGATAPAP